MVIWHEMTMWMIIIMTNENRIEQRNSKRAGLSQQFYSQQECNVGFGIYLGQLILYLSEKVSLKRLISVYGIWCTHTVSMCGFIC